MSWIQKLYETYNNCQSMVGKVVSENAVPLLPICHTTNKAQIEIVIDNQGTFKRAGVVPKDDARTIIPCTEASGGRAGSKPECHPLSDKLHYLAGDFIKYGGEVTSGYAGNPNEPFRNYCELLSNWCNSEFSHPKACAVFKYIQRGRVIEDLIACKVLLIDDDGKLIEKPVKKNKNTPDIFKILNDQLDAFIRWEVEDPNNLCSKAWEDKSLWDRWINYYSKIKQVKSLCYVTGKELLGAEQHPAKLRNDGDKAKLISSNDTSGFTFRGRFTDAGQACGVGFEVTQKAHYALRWLIDRQGYKSKDGQAIVAWATSGVEIPDPLADPPAILGEDILKSDDSDNVSASSTT
jgi:CRISPR-associated protein Csd1